MNKKTLSIIALLIALMLMVFAGCEKEVERGDKEETKKAEETVNNETEANEGGASAGAVGSEQGEGEPAGESGISAEDRVESVAEDFYVPNSDKNDEVFDNRVENIVNGDTNISNIKSDKEIFEGGEFFMIARTVTADNVVNVIKFARSEDKIAMFVDSPDEKMGVILNGDVIYMIMTDEKAYVALPKELMGEEADAMFDAFDTSDIIDEDEEPVDVYTEVIDGVEYTVEVDEEGNKSYSIGEREIMHVSVDGETMYMDELTDIVPDSLFTPPADYKALTLEEFAALM